MDINKTTTSVNPFPDKLFLMKWLKVIWIVFKSLRNRILRFLVRQIECMKHRIECMIDRIECMKDRIECMKDKIKCMKDRIECRIDRIECSTGKIDLIQKRPWKVQWQKSFFPLLPFTFSLCYDSYVKKVYGPNLLVKVLHVLFVALQYKVGSLITKDVALTLLPV